MNKLYALHESLTLRRNTTIKIILIEYIHVFVEAEIQVNYSVLNFNYN